MARALMRSSAMFISSSVRTVQVPVWSEAMDRRRYSPYEATRQTDGNYKVTSGEANYKTQSSNVRLTISKMIPNCVKTQTKVTFVDPKADLAITGLNNADGALWSCHFKFSCYEVSKSSVPTWSEKKMSGHDIICASSQASHGDRYI